ncbi:MAG: hypothetical protein WEC41_06535, partial [Dongiaceae bacterium]
MHSSRVIGHGIFGVWRDRRRRLWRALLFAGLALTLPTAPARADYQAGLMAYDRADYAAALREWQPAAEAGEPRAQHGLGLLYELGRGVDRQDDAEAVRWYRAAAAQGLPAAQSNLGLMYAAGRGVARNLELAAALWRLAAAAGHSMA